MPNWTSNTITGPKVVLNKYLNKDKNFDFNKIIPMPHDLDIESGSSIDWGLVAIYVKSTDKVEKETIRNLWAREHIINKDIESALNRADLATEDDIKTARIAISNYLKHGYTSWYLWRCNHWGTKWNACDSYIESETSDNMTIGFSTAWSTPMPIWEKIIKTNPNCKFIFTWEDEDPGDVVAIMTETGDVVEFTGRHVCNDRDSDEYWEDVDYSEYRNYLEDLLKEINTK